MSNPQDLVTEFHETYGLPIKKDGPGIVGERLALRLELIREEYAELIDAIHQGDIVETADALGDMVYVIYGMAIEFGIPLDKVLDEIQRSNMSKLDENGNPIYREDGKVLKGANWFPPDIEGVLNG